MSRSHGWKPTPEVKARRFGAAHPTAAAAPFPPAFALRSLCDVTTDQNGTSTCYAHCAAWLIALACAAAGKPLPWPFPSPLVIARNTMCEEQPLASGPTLQDVGADLGDVMTALAREGVSAIRALAPGRYSDVTSANVILRPTLADDEGSALAIVLGPEQLQPTVSDFIAQVATSIANMKCGVDMGVHSTPAFENYRKGDPAISDPTGFSITDGHSVAAADYRTNPTTGELEIWLKSSWGDDFGDDGGAWVTASWLMGGGVMEAWRFAAALKGAAS
jgi:hypothetical protein